MLMENASVTEINGLENIGWNWDWDMAFLLCFILMFLGSGANGEVQLLLM